MIPFSGASATSKMGGNTSIRNLPIVPTLVCGSSVLKKNVISKGPVSPACSFTSLRIGCTLHLLFTP